METLSPALRRELRARAHHLHPVVAIGQHGLTPPVLHEIDVALTAHELIKLRVFSDDRAEREALLGRICDELSCASVQHLGKLLVLWRRREVPKAVDAPRAPRARRPAQPPKPQHPPGGRPTAKQRRPHPVASTASIASPASAAGARRRGGAAEAPAGVPRAAAPRRRRAR
ncbi:MAG: YhbY family RNA-binding protein [Betaproteobacteria bacterium]|nr:YhbY family RNA-binding protein [Betaproteobacteria bacterium]